jgi:mono/diheme cytochrome c family protein
MDVSRKSILSIALGAGVVAAGVALALVYRPPINSVARPDPPSLPISLVQRGAALAAIGDCAVCHTAESGTPYAGGRPLATPFGTLYATNITPDEATGIGNWSPAAFQRAMRDGVSRDGRHLYPALPYEHFTHVSDDDLDAIYAFLMTRRAVHAEAPPNKLMFPLEFRPLLAGWKLLFLHKGGFVPSAGESDEWNRGAYLVEGLGHCGGCHTPRNLAGGEEGAKAFSGGVAEGWNASALDASDPSARTWTADTLFAYLRTGIDSAHSAAAGPMGPVAHGLSTAPDSDVRAIAVYIASLMRGKDQVVGSAPLDRDEEAAREHPTGAVLFSGACGSCHGKGAPMMAQGRPGLSLVGAMQEDDPRNTLQAILQGIQPPTGARGPYMPAFSDSLSDRQIAEVAAYLRSRYSTRPAWSKLESAAAAARKEGTEQ